MCVGLGLISQLTMASLGTAMLLMRLDASVPILLQEACVNQGSTALMGLVNQLPALEVILRLFKFIASHYLIYLYETHKQHHISLTVTENKLESNFLKGRLRYLLAFYSPVWRARHCDSSALSENRIY